MDEERAVVGDRGWEVAATVCRSAGQSRFTSKDGEDEDEDEDEASLARQGGAATPRISMDEDEDDTPPLILDPR